MRTGKRMTKVFVAGHRGMVGQAIIDELLRSQEIQIITAEKDELDLTDQHKVDRFFSSNNIDQIYLCAAKVGGIKANNEFPADFISCNLAIQTNVINAAHYNNIDKLLFLGSSCIYPKFAEQPITETALLTGQLEQTNEPYAIAKIAGIKLCESYNRQFQRDYRSVMPTNLYGPGDNFNPELSHVIPALIYRFHEAKIQKSDKVVVWGTGNARREFLHVNDLASACIYVMNLEKNLYLENTKPMTSHINIGSGVDLTINELAKLISSIVNYKGQIIWDKTKPDGTPKKLLDIELISRLGWKSEIPLEKGLKETYEWFLNYSQKT